MSPRGRADEEERQSRTLVLMGIAVAEAKEQPTLELFVVGPAAGVLMGFAQKWAPNQFPLGCAAIVTGAGAFVLGHHALVPLADKFSRDITSSLRLQSVVSQVLQGVVTAAAVLAGYAAWDVGNGLALAHDPGLAASLPFLTAPIMFAGGTVIGWLEQMSRSTQLHAGSSSHSLTG